MISDIDIVSAQDWDGVEMSMLESEWREMQKKRGHVEDDGAMKPDT
jgi:hypothetical protein